MKFVKQGEYLIIRIDGTETRVQARPSLHAILKQIKADSIDTVLLDRQGEQIMIVDDTGMTDGKRVNPKATEIYHTVCAPGTKAYIYGDVAIVHDEDFA